LSSTTPCAHVRVGDELALGAREVSVHAVNRKAGQVRFRPHLLDLIAVAVAQRHVDLCACDDRGEFHGAVGWDTEGLELRWVAIVSEDDHGAVGGTREAR
jgi:hypothetical protein